jgi:hypothetical protein
MKWSWSDLHQMLPAFTKLNTTLEIAHDKWYELQIYLQVNKYKCVSDLWQVGGFLQVLRFPLSIKLTNFIGGGNHRTRKNYRPVASHRQTLSHNVVDIARIEIRTLPTSVMIGADCIGSI